MITQLLFSCDLLLAIFDSVVCKWFLLIIVRFVNHILVVHNTLLFHLVVLFRLNVVSLNFIIHGGSTMFVFCYR
jgi:hypothetical protein